MFAPWQSQKSLYKFKDPINGNSFIRVMIISNWMMLIDRESLHTPGLNCVTTKYLWAGIVVWELKIKNVLNVFGNVQLRYKQLQALMGD